MSGDSLYGPMVDVLYKAFGVTFELWDTGGGCDALIGELESGIAVYITDAPNSPYGQECTITAQVERDRIDCGTVAASRGDSLVGFAVGVYRDEHSTQISYGEYPDAATDSLPRIVAEQLAAAVKAWCPDLDTPQERNEL